MLVWCSQKYFSGHTVMSSFSGLFPSSWSSRLDRPSAQFEAPGLYSSSMLYCLHSGRYPATRGPIFLGSR